MMSIYLKRVLFSIVFVCIGVLGTFVFFLWNFLYNPLPVSNKSVIVMMEDQISFEQFTHQLKQQGLLRHAYDPVLMILFAKHFGLNHALSGGEFEINPGMTEYVLLKKISKGEFYYRKITLVEGRTLSIILKKLKESPYLIHDVTEAETNWFFKRIDIANPEGLFFPATYRYLRPTKESKILEEAFSLLKNKLLNAWERRDPHCPFQTPYEALIAASLIEKETAKENERYLVAGVIKNRLEKNMRLQMDPSVIYAFGGHFTKEDLKTDSPYNLYRVKGLPPSPICSPSLSSIEAALHPTPTTALYYVTQGDGTLAFADTFIEHRVNVEKYREAIRFKTTKLSIPTCSEEDNSEMNPLCNIQKPPLMEDQILKELKTW